MKTSLTTVLIAAGVSLLALDTAALAHTDVTAKQARELIESTTGLIVIDVRERYEYCGIREHIPAALNYPWRSQVLQARFQELPIDGPILVVCGSGGRSHTAATFLDDNGFSNVYDMLGGMNAWQWETAPCMYSAGSGTPEDPYELATTDDLILLAESPDDFDKHFILTADVDLDPNLPGRRVFSAAVIAPDNDTAEPGYQGTPFTGTFDGNGHTISRLTITGGGYLGLFGQLDLEAHISNLALEAVDVNGTADHVGGLVGLNRTGSITACFTSGTVTASGMDVGGLAGQNRGDITTSCSVSTVNGVVFVGGLTGTNLGEVVQCYSAGAVSGIHAVGGLVGFSVGPAISDCYSTGSVAGDDKVGGLVGFNLFTNVVRCYSTGGVTGNSHVGGLLGMNVTRPGDPATSSFWDVQTSSQADTAGAAMGKATAEMQTTATFLEAGWDFGAEIKNGIEDIWWILDGKDYPRLWWEADR